MSFPDIVPGLKSKMPALRGRLLANQSLAELTWFRVGGPAQVGQQITKVVGVVRHEHNLRRPKFPSLSLGSVPT